jgi:hypothetical protein
VAIFVGSGIMMQEAFLLAIFEKFVLLIEENFEILLLSRHFDYFMLSNVYTRILEGSKGAEGGWGGSNDIDFNFLRQTTWVTGSSTAEYVTNICKWPEGKNAYFINNALIRIKQKSASNLS